MLTKEQIEADKKLLADRKAQDPEWCYQCGMEDCIICQLVERRGEAWPVYIAEVEALRTVYWAAKRYIDSLPAPFGAGECGNSDANIFRHAVEDFARLDAARDSK